MTEFLNTVAALILSSQLATASSEVSTANLVTTYTNDTVAILAFDKSEFRGTPVRGKHVAIAVSGFGDVVGAVLNKRGTALCKIVGFFDGECVTLSGCGANGTVC